MTPEQVGQVWQGVWAEPGMPGQPGCDEISYSGATNDGDAGAAPRLLDVITGSPNNKARVDSDNAELSTEHHTPVDQ